MGQYIIRRILQVIPVIIIVTILVFSLTHMLPGDITTTIIGEEATPQQRAMIEEEYGLNDPIIVQYFNWMGHALRGDLGRSYRDHQLVTEMIKQRVPATFELALLSMLIAIIIGVPAGMISSTRRNSALDIGATLFSMFGMAVPIFWLAILLIILFSLKIRILPPSGYMAFIQDPIANLRLMILPSVTIGITMAATIMRQTRGAMLGVLNQPYIDTARAKGLPEREVTNKHALRNALIPVVTVIGLQTGTLMGGALLSEIVFSIPGLGRMITQGIFNRDFPAVQGGILVFVMVVVVMNIITDIAYAVLDPRIKYK